MESLSPVRSRNYVDEREQKKNALHSWLMSQPQEVLVESLLKGVLSPHTMEVIVKKARKEYDNQHGATPIYKNLQVNGVVDGVKIGLRVFTGDGRRAGKVIGFEPAISHLHQHESATGSSSAVDSTACSPAACSPSANGSGGSPATQVQGSKKAQGKRPAKAAKAAASVPAPTSTPGAFVVQWSSKPPSARNTYDGPTERVSLASLKQLTWRKPPQASKGAEEGDWTKGVFDGFYDDVCRRAQAADDDAQQLWLWLQLTPPLLAAFEHMVRAASVVNANTGHRWGNDDVPPGTLSVLPETKEIEISIAGMRTVVPAPELMYTRKLEPMRPPLACVAGAAAAAAGPHGISFCANSLLKRIDEHHSVIGSTSAKPGRVGSFLHVRGPRARPSVLTSLLSPAASLSLSTSSCTTLTHLYQPAPPLLRLYIWVLQRRGLTTDLVQHVVRFLLLRKDDALDDSRRTRRAEYTKVTRTPPRAPPKPAIVVALSPAQLNMLKQYADLFSADGGGGFAASHRAELLTVVVSTDAAGAPSLFLGLSGNSDLDVDDLYERRRVTRASLVLQPPSASFTEASLTWPETIAYRSFKAVFDVRDGSNSSLGERHRASELVDILLNAAPKMRAELRVRMPVANHVEQDDGGLSLWLTLPKGGHVSVDAPCIEWQTNPPADVKRAHLLHG